MAETDWGGTGRNGWPADGRRPDKLSGALIDGVVTKWRRWDELRDVPQKDVQVVERALRLFPQLVSAA